MGLTTWFNSASDFQQRHFAGISLQDTMDLNTIESLDTCNVQRSRHQTWLVFPLFPSFIMMAATHDHRTLSVQEK